MFGKINITLKGETPLLMNKLTVEKLQSSGRKVTQKYDVEEEARESAYLDEIDGEEQLYVPMEAVYGMILNTCAQYKIGKFRAKRLLAGTIRIEPEKIPLGTNKYEIDLRPVNIRGSRVVRARAKVPEWELNFKIIYDKTIKGDIPGVIHEILKDGGKRTGLLDYRPQRSGWFGTFTVQEFEELS